jgi:hypothetical protein
MQMRVLVTELKTVSPFWSIEKIQANKDLTLNKESADVYAVTAERYLAPPSEQHSRLFIEVQWFTTKKPKYTIGDIIEADLTDSFGSLMDGSVREPGAGVQDSEQSKSKSAG